jgi:hypothetical protein
VEFWACASFRSFFSAIGFWAEQGIQKMISYIICYSQYGRFPGDKHWNLTTDQFTQECVHAIPLLTMYLHSLVFPWSWSGTFGLYHRSYITGNRRMKVMLHLREDHNSLSCRKGCGGVLSWAGGCFCFCTKGRAGTRVVDLLR